MAPKCSVFRGSMKCSATAVDRQTIEIPLKYRHNSLYMSLQNVFALLCPEGFSRDVQFLLFPAHRTEQ